jgi:2-oxo-4-hydroxy-4-carboxy-5-ureidoimidazoline decarboxylase
MSDSLAELNALSHEEALTEFQRCCGATQWTNHMAASRPYASAETVHRAADTGWSRATREDILEAFSHHPKIGGVDALRTRFSSTSDWSEGEQAGVSQIETETLQALADGNASYERKFGFIFIVCATGKSADEMLNLLNQRLEHDPDSEITIAAEEQRKIMHIRLEKLITPAVTSNP